MSLPWRTIQERTGAPPAILHPEAVRARFPALRRVHGVLPVAYFDGPGGTQVPEEVVQAVSGYLVEHNANTHWAYPSSRETDAILDSARETMADLLGGRPEEISFGSNMTTLTYHLSRALGRAWGPGDEVVVTELDHHANIDPWRRLVHERGITLRMVRMDAGTGTLDMDHLGECVTPDTRLVAVGAASNALGTVNPLEEVRALSAEVGALLFVDAVHAAAHLPLDVAALGCDFLACSPYKFYGPHVGVLWTQREILAELDVPRLEPASNAGGERLETGTLSHEGIAGAAAAVDFLASLSGSGGRATERAGSRRERILNSMEGLHIRGAELFRSLYDGLAALPGVRLHGPPAEAPRTPTLAFTMNGLHPGEVARRLAEEHALFLSDGDFYAATVVDRLGLRESGGLVRAGIACYTSLEEVDRLVEGVAALAAVHR